MLGGKRTLFIGGAYVFILALSLFGVLLGNQAVTTAAVNTPVRRTHTIIVDAGHGGEDGGATSCTGKLESAYNLEVARRLDDLLRLLGYETVMIRTTDTSVYTSGQTIAQKKVSDLKERVRIVNDTDGAVLVSIHQNTFSDARYSGPQVFYGESSGSAALAKAMQTALNTALAPDSRRQEKQGTGIYLLEKIQKPGVLIECGFLSNAAEEALLRTPAYQKKLAAVIAVTLSRQLCGA